MQTSSLLIPIAFVLASTSASAGDGESFAEYMYKKMPKITTYEKHCIIKYDAGTELERCLEARPDTELHNYAKERSRRHINTLNELAIKYQYEHHDSGGGPWFDFCLETASDACLWDCLNGWVCADK